MNKPDYVRCLAAIMFEVEYADVTPHQYEWAKEYKATKHTKLDKKLTEKVDQLYAKLIGSTSPKFLRY